MGALRKTLGFGCPERVASRGFLGASWSRGQVGAALWKLAVCQLLSMSVFLVNPRYMDPEQGNAVDDTHPA